MAWFTAGPQTNPADQAILADTGAITIGNNTIATVVVTANAQASVVVERRDATNATTLTSQFIRCPANDTKVVSLGTVALAINERLRVLNSGALAGIVQASLSY